MITQRTDATPIALAPCEQVEITVLIDNLWDMLLPNEAGVQRPRMRGKLPASLYADGEMQRSLVAEHGFAAQVTLTRGGRRHRFLFDAGLSRDGLVHNMDVLDLDTADLELIVLSHGHFDHTGGLHGLLERLGARRMPLLLHPDAFRRRAVIAGDEPPRPLPPLSRRALVEAHVEVIEETAPSLLFEGMALVTGQVERTAPFETGFPTHFAQRDGGWEPDPLICDDQALIVRLAGRGLVILTGCGHAGAINILRHARRITGEQRVHAMIGGFHLGGPAFEPIIPPTIAELQAASPDLIVPAHCTGWKAVHAIAAALPAAFRQSSAGTRFILNAAPNDRMASETGAQLASGARSDL